MLGLLPHGQGKLIPAPKWFLPRMSNSGDIHSLHSPPQYLLNVCYVPGTVVGTEDIVGTEIAMAQSSRNLKSETETNKQNLN